MYQEEPKIRTQTIMATNAPHKVSVDRFKIFLRDLKYPQQIEQ